MLSLSTQKSIARPGLLGVLVSGQYGHDIENGDKVTNFCFKTLDKDLQIVLLITNAY